MIPALFDALPRAGAVLPWTPLGEFPTPVEQVRGLLPRDVDLWVKREDLSAVEYGGNKVRKLEFILADATARGGSHLVTFGGTGSHHVLATAIHARRQGFTLEASVFRQPEDDHVGEVTRAAHAAGAKLAIVPSLYHVLPRMLRARIEQRGVWLAGGGSCPIGTFGWVSGAYEILAQIRSGALPPVDAIYVALGSCGTVAGLLVGLRGAKPPSITAVRVVHGTLCGERRTRDLARDAAKMLRPLGLAEGREPRLTLEGRFLGAGYGHPTLASREAVEVARDSGLELEPIYTGKVMAALFAHAREGRLKGKRVLFIHTASHERWRPRRAGEEAL